MKQWKEDGSDTAPGPKAAHYESVRKEVGAHLLYNAFWLVNHFCVHQMLMQDRMHTIDLGVINTDYYTHQGYNAQILRMCEIFLDKEGLAASKLETLLATRTGQDN